MWLGSIASPSRAWVTGTALLRPRISGNTLCPLTWSATKIEPGKGAGNPRTTELRASTPPAEAPITTMSCFKGTPRCPLIMVRSARRATGEWPRPMIEDVVVSRGHVGLRAGGELLGRSRGDLRGRELAAGGAGDPPPRSGTG